MPSPKTTNRTLWIVFVLALVIRLLLSGVVIAHPERAAAGTDATQYLTLGHNLATQGIFSQESAPPYTPDAIRTPGYPALIALLTWLSGPRPITAIVLVQAVLGALVALGAALLARRLLGAPAATSAGVLTALAPGLTILGGFASAEVVFAAWLIGGSLLLLAGLDRADWQITALGGLCFGAATLTRPIGVMLLPAVLIVAAIHGLTRQRQRIAWGQLAATAAAFLLLPGLWMGRNAVTFGHFSLSTISGVNLFYYNTAGMEARRQGVSLDEARRSLEAELDALPPPDPDWPSDQMSTLARQKILTHLMTFVWTNALDALNGLRPGFSYMLLLLGDPDTVADPIRSFSSGGLRGALAELGGQGSGLLTVELLMTALMVLLVGLALIGAVMLAVRGRWLALALPGLIAAILLYLPGAASNARFRAPTEPFLALLAGAAIAALTTRRNPATGETKNSDGGVRTIK